MLSKDNFSEEHIRQIQNDCRRDPLLIERTLFAFGLLEALVLTGLKFTFKGGTSLMLLLSKPMRLSTDIDIIVSPDTDIDDYIKKAGIIFPFTSVKEQRRIQTGNIVKRHFMFTYESPIRTPDTLHIFLDVLFEENHYEKIIQKEIANDLLVTEGKNLIVSIPAVDCILGDKLTAFAPHTTGIRFGKKNLEIMKQFFDISVLIDAHTDFHNIRNTYFSVSDTEIRYRNIDCTPQDALMDTINAALCIGSRGKTLPSEFQHYLEGSRRVHDHIFAAGFSMEQASRMAPKIIYMASCLLTDTPFTKPEDPALFKNESLNNPDLIPMKGLKKIDPSGYAYLIKTDRLLTNCAHSL